mgnify:FL=1
MSYQLQPLAESPLPGAMTRFAVVAGVAAVVGFVLFKIVLRKKPK